MGDPDAAILGDAGAEHRRLAVDANNSTWELLAKEDGWSVDEIDDLLARAYAAAYHWARAADRTAANGARASWLISRAHAVLGHGDLALHHADQSHRTVVDAGLGDFDLAYAHEARARALACLGRLDEARTERAAAAAVPIAGDEDRAMTESDLASPPWFGLDS